MEGRPVTILLREVRRNPGHVRIRVFVGRQPGARGVAGELTLRVDEWDEICEEIQGSKDQSAEVNFAADKIEIDRPAHQK